MTWRRPLLRALLISEKNTSLAALYAAVVCSREHRQAKQDQHPKTSQHACKLIT
jgi:hypothetical protein